MAAPVKAFAYGVKESFESLVDNSAIIAIGTVSSAGIGFLVGGTPGAWLAAKVTALVLGVVFAIDPATISIDINVLSNRTSRAAGNIVTALWIPFFLVLCAQRVLR